MRFWFESNFNFLNKCIHQIYFFASCNKVKSSASMIDVNTVTCFFATQSINSSNSLKAYSSADFQSFSLTNETSTFASKTCLSLSWSFVVIVNSSSLNAMYLIFKYLMFEDISCNDSLQLNDQILNWSEIRLTCLLF